MPNSPVIQHKMYPLLATEGGHVVLYRMPGDAWQVARDDADIEHLTGLSDAQRKRSGIQVVLATPENRDA